MEKKNFRPDRILAYFQVEWKTLIWITISGLIYNLGLMAGPWSEGKMVGCLMRILTGAARFSTTTPITTALLPCGICSPR